MENIAWMAWTLPTAIFFVLLGGACLIGWKMTAERHAEVRAQLELKDAAAAAEAGLGLAQS